VGTTVVQEFSPEDEVFLREVGRQHRAAACLRLERTPAFLHWRLRRNPRYAYQVLRCRGAEGLHGWLTLKTFRDPLSGETSGDIMDVIWREDDPHVARGLLLSGLAYFERLGIAQATTWLDGNPLLAEVGRSLGFRPTPRRRYLSCRATDQRLVWMEDLSRWSVSMLDTDLY
jgi:hypothetical protein